MLEYLRNILEATKFVNCCPSSVFGFNRQKSHSSYKNDQSQHLDSHTLISSWQAWLALFMHSNDNMWDSRVYESAFPQESRKPNGFNVLYADNKFKRIWIKCIFLILHVFSCFTFKLIYKNCINIVHFHF